MLQNTVFYPESHQKAAYICDAAKKGGSDKFTKRLFEVFKITFPDLFHLLSTSQMLNTEPLPKGNQLKGTASICYQITAFLL